MPYRRKYRKKFRSRRKRTGGYMPYIKGAYSAYTLARRAMAGIWKLKGLVNSEMHKLDMTASNSVDTTGVADPMCKVAVGDTYDTRTGNSIYVRSLNIKGDISYNTSFTGPQFVRLAVVQDTQQIGDTNPTTGDIYEGTGAFCHLNPNTVGRFKVLYNQCYSVDQYNPARVYDINIPLRHHVRYNGSLNTDIQRGALYFVQMSTASTNTPVVSYRARLSFHDN